MDTQRLTLEVQAELNWSDELTKDVAQRIVEKQDYNLIVKEMKRKYGVDVLGGVAIIYTCYNAERDGVTLNELFTGYTHNSSEVPYIRGGGFNVRVPNLNRKKPEFKTITQAELDKFVKSVKDRRPKNDPRNTTVDKPKETPEPPNPSSSARGTGQALKVPQGLTQAQFDKVSSMIREKVGHISDDIVVQGSRAKGTAKPTSDIDIAIRVPSEKFDELIQSSFSKVKPPNPGSAKEKTMLHAIETGKIQSGEAKLSKFREQLQQELGMDVDISIIKIGGPFDNPPFTPLK
ncbi:nucleotidyltransferase domain-containing protein [Paenibacillus lentus]|nr:nucleotidyltransferase domain-containing protein [Paenibacillus lentus]